MLLSTLAMILVAGAEGQGKRRFPNYGMGMNFGKGYPVVNPYFPGLGGGLDIFNGLNPNKEPTSPYIKQVSTNCRMVEVKEFGGKEIKHYKECSDIKMMAYNWLIEDMEPQGGACRWQGGVKATDESEERKGVCLCPATTKELCTKNRASCYFHTDRKTKEDTCISKPERFYNQLARLLAKRGKKDFSMKIQYGGSGARGYLPMGLQGPSLVGRGNPYLGHHNRMAYGNFGPQGFGSFGFSPNYQYRTGQGFGGFGGHGPQGNYNASGPGAAAWGNPSSPFAPSFSPFTGYGGGFFGPAKFPSPISPAYGSAAQGYGQAPQGHGQHQAQGYAQQPQPMYPSQQPPMYQQPQYPVQQPQYPPHFGAFGQQSAYPQQGAQQSGASDASAPAPATAI